MTSGMGIAGSSSKAGSGSGRFVGGSSVPVGEGLCVCEDARDGSAFTRGTTDNGGNGGALSGGAGRSGTGRLASGSDGWGVSTWSNCDRGIDGSRIVNSNGRDSRADSTASADGIGGTHGRAGRRRRSTRSTRNGGSGGLSRWDNDRNNSLSPLNCRGVRSSGRASGD